MIHNNSADPVLIKKIHLQIWLLRDEIENVIMNSLSGDPAEVRKTIALLRKEYNGNAAEGDNEGPAPDNVLDLPVGGAEEDDPEELSAEDGAAELLAAAEAAEEDDEEEAESEEEIEEAPEMLASEQEGELPEGLEEAAGEEIETQAEETAQTQSAEETEPPFEEKSQGITLADFLPEETTGGVGILQRRPKLEPVQMMRAMCFLSELNMDAIYFFSNEKMMAGQSVVIDFLVPQRFLFMAEVIHCRPYNMRSRIISSTPHPFRVAARPLFLKAGERTLLREFLETVEPDLEAIAAQQKAKKPIKKKEEEDDLDDLDDLDL